MRYRTAYRSRRDRRPASSGAYSYLMPFLILICLGIVVVLAVKLWDALFDDQENVAAYMHFVEGSAQMKVWGTDSFFPLDSDSIVKSGDEIVASADARIIVEFFDGTIMRMDGGTDVVFQEIAGDAASPELDILLVDGKLWFNKVYKDVSSTDLKIVVDNIVLRAAGESNFEIQNEFDEAVHMIHGDDIEVDILSEEGKVVDTEKVGVGQQVIFTDEVLETYWLFQSPNILSAISDVFTRSEWYLWNFDEDKSPTKFKKIGSSDFVEVEPEEMDEEELTPEDVELSVSGEDELSVTGEDEEELESEEEEPLEEGDVAQPTITSVAGVTETNADGFYVISNKVGTLIGSVEGATDVEVSGYVLTQFSAGATQWIYHANADFDLMVEGENIFEIVAIDADGNRSKPLTVKVLYQPAAPAPTPTPTPDPEPEVDPAPETEQPPAGETSEPSA